MLTLVSALIPGCPLPSRREYLTEYNDTLATLLLAGTTQSLAGLAELSDRLGLAYERSGRRGRGGGGGMTAASLYGM
jgi:hypothetical protein